MTRLLLTGATGFLGSQLLRSFIRNGHEVVALKRSNSNLCRVADLGSLCRFYDVDHLPLSDVFKNQQVNVIVHVATAYGRRGETNLEISQANIEYPSRLIDCGIEAGVTCFVNTDSFFTKGNVLPSGLPQYCLTKRRFLDAVVRRCKDAGMGFINLRLEHMYGPNDDVTKFVPYLIDSFLKNKSHLDLTPGEQRRDFVHVHDVVRAFNIVLAGSLTELRVQKEFEIGTGSSLSVKAVAELIRDACGANTELRFGALPYRDDEIMNSSASLDAVASIGWHSQVNLLDGLTGTINFEKSKRQRLVVV